MTTIENADKDRYKQCNFCLERENVYEIRNPKTWNVVSICKTCINDIHAAL